MRGGRTADGGRMATPTAASLRRTYRDHVAGEQGPADDRQALVEVRDTWRRSCVVRVSTGARRRRSNVETHHRRCCGCRHRTAEAWFTLRPSIDHCGCRSVCPSGVPSEEKKKNPRTCVRLDASHWHPRARDWLSIIHACQARGVRCRSAINPKRVEGGES